MVRPLSGEDHGRPGSREAAPGDDPRRSARLLTALVVGLLHLGQEDRTWWERDVVTDLWAPLLPSGADTAAGPVPEPAH
ncbi:hypothetical protein [Streptomyces sp. Ac-502]|uniref:hypothetical protein n=1 Tax=Streptomyces sp. Ac-502 TaxID=3342801 RepID=UPI0038627754